MMSSFSTLATLFGLGFFSGLNLYAVIFVSGLAIRFHWLSLTPGLKSLEILSHPTILTAAGVMYVVEFFADKIPWVDNVWDVIHSIVRPLAASFLALYVLGEQNMEIRILAALICGSLALTSHSAKATARLTTNIASPMEPFSNIALSVSEDVIAIGSLYFVYNHPVITLAVVAFFVALIIWFAPKVIRGMKSVWRSVFGPRPVGA